MMHFDPKSFGLQSIFELCTIFFYSLPVIIRAIMSFLAVNKEEIGCLYPQWNNALIKG